MKVLFVDQFSINEGKDVFYLAKKINEIQSFFKVELYFRRDDNKKYAQDKLTKIHFDFGDAYHGNIIKKVYVYLASLHRLCKFVKDSKFDIVVLQWFSIPWIEKSFIKKLKKQCKVITIVHDIVPFSNKFGMISALRTIYKSSDLVFVHSEMAKKEFANIYSKTTPVHLVSNAFCDKHLYTKMPLYEARQKLGIELNRFVVLFYGSVRESKGLDVLMEAVFLARKREPNIYLLVGGALQGLSKERQDFYLKLGERINTSNSGKVCFGFVDDEVEPYYFSSANVLCLPYKNGWQSGVAQLGLCYELPLLSSDIEEMRGVVVDGFNGILFKNMNASDLCDKVVYMCRNNNKLQQYSSNSIVLYDKKFTIDKKAVDFIAGFHLLSENK